MGARQTPSINGARWAWASFAPYIVLMFVRTNEGAETRNKTAKVSIF